MIDFRKLAAVDIAFLGSRLIANHRHQSLRRSLWFRVAICTLKATSGNLLERLHLPLSFSFMAPAAPMPCILAASRLLKQPRRLAPTFIKHGYAFLDLFRRGQGLSADQGPFMQDVLQREKDTKGEKARKRLQFVLLTTDHLDDVTAGLLFLKNLPGVDSRRIAVVGHSFGGQLTLLAAERDTSLRAAVTFSAAASSWENRRSYQFLDEASSTDERCNGCSSLTLRPNKKLDLISSVGLRPMGGKRRSTILGTLRGR